MLGADLMLPTCCVITIKEQEKNSQMFAFEPMVNGVGTSHFDYLYCENQLKNILLINGVEKSSQLLALIQNSRPFSEWA